MGRRGSVLHSSNGFCCIFFGPMDDGGGAMWGGGRNPRFAGRIVANRATGAHTSSPLPLYR